MMRTGLKLALAGLMAVALAASSPAAGRVVDGMDDGTWQATAAPAKATLSKRTAPAAGGRVGFEMGLDMGYTYLLMDDYSQNYRDIDSSEPWHHAGYVGFNAGATFFDDILEAGMRFEYITTSYSYERQYFDHYGDYIGSDTITNKISLTPVTLGFRVRTPGSVSFVASVDMGMGFARYESSSDAYQEAVAYEGTCPVLDARLGLRFGKQLHFQMDAGYRNALVTNMSWNSNMNLDFSGYSTGIKLGVDI